MAYFLKKTKLKGRTYLAIYESFYDPVKKETAQKSYKSLGALETHVENGMKDPLAHFQKEVDYLNEKRKEDKERKISDKSPMRYLGYFPLKSILEKLKVKRYVGFFKLTNDLNTIFSSSFRPLSMQEASIHVAKTKPFTTFCLTSLSPIITPMINSSMA